MNSKRRQETNSWAPGASNTGEWSVQKEEAIRWKRVKGEVGAKGTESREGRRRDKQSQTIFKLRLKIRRQRASQQCGGKTGKSG
jgi:hypothetical protein